MPNPHPDPPANLTQDIAALSDHDALTTLAIIATRHGLPNDPDSLTTLNERIRQAATHPPPDGLNPQPAPPAHLARTALTHLAADPTRHDEVARALQLTHQPNQRFEPATLAVGALILFAFHADIDLRKDPDTGWHFHLKTSPLPESTIGQILSQLLGHIGNPNP